MLGATDADEQAPPRPPWWRRALDLPLWVHAAALALLLVALVPVVGTRAGFLPDEGAAVLQAELVQEGEWTTPHPHPEVDPEGTSQPIRNALEGEDGSAPLAKHPAWAWTLARSPSGVGGMLLLTVAGTVAAAACAALLARRIDPRTDRATLWAVGVASPLLFDAFLLVAHSVGAACAGAAALLVVRSRRAHPAQALLVAAPVLVLVALRNEGALLAGAAAVVLVVLAARGREVCLALGAVAIIGSTVAARLLDGWLETTLVPGSATGVVTAGAGQGDLLATRVQATLITTVLPGYVLGLGALVLLLALLCTVVGAVRARSGDPAVVLWWGVAAALYVLRLLAAPGAVPGLLVAFPVLVAGLLTVRRRSLRGPAAPLLATFALFAAAVFATQYAKGGTGEWGARYLAIGLPLVVPVAVASLAAALDDVRARAPEAARRAVGALVVASLATALLAVGALRSAHEQTDALTEAVLATAEATAPAPDGGAPVVLTTVAALPRLAWPTAGDLRWLLADDDELTPLLDRLDAEGVSEVVLVTRGSDDGGLGLGPFETIRLEERDGGWDLRTLGSAAGP